MELGKLTIPAFNSDPVVNGLLCEPFNVQSSSLQPSNVLPQSLQLVRRTILAMRSWSIDTPIRCRNSSIRASLPSRFEMRFLIPGEITRETASHDLTSLNPSLPVVPPFLNEATRSQGQRLLFNFVSSIGIEGVGNTRLFNDNEDAYHQLPHMLFRPQTQVPPKPAKPFS